ncbi:MAG: SoxR reducing system RseC family protein [Oscillospiraceae bacterium]|nr:SoxR reducing system RseC family protein [Oscillospiraceae bacterium]
MEQQVRVRRVFDDGTAEVIRVRESACSGDCHQCAGCGAAKETIKFRVRDPIGVLPGDVVIVQAKSAPVLRAAAILYLIPLALFYVGFYLGALLGSGALGGCLAFALGIALVVLYDRRVASKEKTEYTITGYAEIPEKRG